MDDDLRAIERMQALAERHARLDAEGWRHAPAPRRPLRAHLAAALVALAARLAPEPITPPAIRRAARPDAAA